MTTKPTKLKKIIMLTGIFVILFGLGYISLLAFSGRTNIMYRGISGTIHDIEFTGKIIDQHGNPVPEVEILYIGSTTYFGGGSGYNRLHTDKNGFFTISDKEGSALDLREMLKEDYEITLVNQGKLFYSFKKYPYSLVWGDYTPENPYIYRAWKISDEFDSSLELKKDDFGSVIETDGTKYGIDFFAPGRRKIKTGDDINKGQVIIQQIWEGKNPAVKENRWRFIITAVDGGIVKADSMYSSEAPINGYKSSIEFTQDDVTLQKYKFSTYFTFIDEGRKKFGRATWEFSNVFKPERTSFLVAYTTNPSGERYLPPYGSKNSKLN